MSRRTTGSSSPSITTADRTTTPTGGHCRGKRQENVHIVHPQTGQKAVSLEDAKLGLVGAHKAHAKIAAELSEVQKRKDIAMAALNTAQAVFDAAVGDIRAQAPEGSSWTLAKGESA